MFIDQALSEFSTLEPARVNVAMNVTMMLCDCAEAAESSSPSKRDDVKVALT